MDNATTEKFQNLFLTLKKQYEEKSLLWEALSSNKSSGDEVDQALGARDELLLLKLNGRERFFLKKINWALKKIEKGTFGSCEECDCDISESRLWARPTATLCISCKEEEELGENKISYHKKSHTHGQEIVNENVIPLRIGERNENNPAPKKIGAPSLSL